MATPEEGSPPDELHSSSLNTPPCLYVIYTPSTTADASIFRSAAVAPHVLSNHLFYTRRKLIAMAYLGYVRFPTIHGEQIVFTAEDDLWLVTTAGGRAERLTAGVAEITNARFSPDGQSLAFTGKDEGPTEVYVMPLDGGVARRLTYEGCDSVIAGWRPDGSGIVYTSSAYQPSRRWRALHEVAPTGGEPRVLPYGVAHSIAFGPHSALIVGRNTEEPAHWKRYRGGTAGYLWIDENGSGEFRRLLNLNSNIASPCWANGRVYFLSDHEGIANVYSVLPSGEDLRRHSDQRDY